MLELEIVTLLGTFRNYEALKIVFGRCDYRIRKSFSVFHSVRINGYELQVVLLNLCIREREDNAAILNTLRMGLLNCLNARSRGLNFRHRASCK